MSMKKLGEKLRDNAKDSTDLEQVSYSALDEFFRYEILGDSLIRIQRTEDGPVRDYRTLEDLRQFPDEITLEPIDGGVDHG